MGKNIFSRLAEGNNSMKRRWWVAGIVALHLTGGAFFWRLQAEGWDFSWAALTGEPIAVVNGEAVTRAAFHERLSVGRGMLERQYGKGLFAGEEGKGLLAELEADVLEKLIHDRLVAQEAQRLNLAVSDGEVQQQLDAIGKEVYGTRESFQTSLREEGISPEYLFGHIRNMLLRQEVEKAKHADGVDAPVGFWLAQARQEARITLTGASGSSSSYARRAGSCCDVAGAAGVSGNGSSGSEVAPELQNEAAAAALVAFRKNNPAGKDPRTRITDYGCHLQVDVEVGGRVVRSYSYQDGAVSEI